MGDAMGGTPPGPPLRQWLQRLWGGEGILLLVSVAQSIVVARVLGVNDFGVAALIMAVPMMVFVFLDPQSEEAVIRFMAQARSDGEPPYAWDVVRLAYRIDLLLALIGVAVVGVISQVGVAAVGVPDDHGPLLLVSALGAAAHAPSTTARAALTSVERFGVIAGATSSGAVVQAICSVAGTVLGGLTGFVVGSSLGMALTSGIFLAAAAPVRHATGAERASGPLRMNGRTREILRFMVVTELTTLSSSLVKHLDVLVLGAATGTQSVGIYRLARSVSTPVGAILRPLQLVTYPRMEALGSRGEPDAMKEEIRRYLLTVCLPLVVAGCIALGSVPVVLPLLAGAAYSASVAPAMVLGAGSVVAVAAFWVRPAALALRRETTMFAISLGMTVLTVAGYLLVAAPYGATGVATVRAVVAGLAGNAIATVVILRALRRMRSQDQLEDLSSKA